MFIILQGAQMLCVAFGSLVLVPLLTGLDPNVALFGAGMGTLIFQLITKRMVPVFLASSFAFIAPISFGIAHWGLPATLGGLVVSGAVYLVLSSIVKLYGVNIIHKLFPPVVVGPVIMVIGLGLAPVAVNMAFGKTGDGHMQLINQHEAIIISSIALLTTILISVYSKGFLKLFPIVSGVLAGYGTSLYFGVVSFAPIHNASWFSLPNFTFPEFHINAILYMLPVAIAPAVEHVGDILAISNITGKDYLKNPGLHRTLAGDGIATMFATCFGGPPNTTYSEVTGAVMLTKSFNPVIMTWAAVTAITLAFVGKLGAILQTVPTAVLGGIMILLFGSIAGIGLNTLIRNNVDLHQARNLVIVAVTLVFGIGGVAFGFGPFDIHMGSIAFTFPQVTLQGVSLCSIAAIILNLILPKALGETHVVDVAQID